ncbi:MAG: hypothetical protein GX575_21935 [Candidatus Anammoximicrobium sp.]|nr:hypothetical protein [Candidatus Anammoximicrobium sp.]
MAIAPFLNFQRHTAEDDPSPLDRMVNQIGELRVLSSPIFFTHVAST